MKHLGEDLDIHCGGIDNAFPHHTNEIAQSESCLGEIRQEGQFGPVIGRSLQHVVHRRDAQGGVQVAAQGGGYQGRSRLAESLRYLFCAV